MAHDEKQINLPPPQSYPGKYTRKNVSGTVLTKDEWMLQETSKWYSNMKKNSDKYDEQLFHKKALYFSNWLKKTFKKI